MPYDECPMEGCTSTLGFSPYWSNRQVAEQVNRRGWFIWNGVLVCGDHLKEDGPGPGRENVIDFPLDRALRRKGVSSRADE